MILLYIFLFEKCLRFEQNVLHWRKSFRRKTMLLDLFMTLISLMPCYQWCIYFDLLDFNEVKIIKKKRKKKSNYQLYNEFSKNGVADRERWPNLYIISYLWSLQCFILQLFCMQLFFFFLPYVFSCTLINYILILQSRIWVQFAILHLKKFINLLSVSR